MKKIKSAISLLAIGKTAVSTETTGFKRYVGIGSSFVRGVQPTKAEIDEFFGYESQSEPEYVVDTERGKEARITFLVQTDPETCGGIDLKARAMFTLRATPAYNRNETKVQVIDQYGNHSWANVEDAKAGKALVGSNGNSQKIDTKYRMACVGECDLIDFLKAYLCVEDVFKYVNGTWVKKDNPEQYQFALEHIKDYFSGDFKELKDAIALQPNNKVKLLYGVRSNEGKQYQAVATKGDLILRNSAGSNALANLGKNLVSTKQAGTYTNTDFQICPLKEYTVAPTNLEKPVKDEDMPFDTPSDTTDEIPWD